MKRRATVPMPPLGLIEALKNGSAVAVVGSGLSLAAGLPSWERLLLGLAAAADETQIKRRREIASAIVELRQGAYLDAGSILKKVLGPEFLSGVVHEIVNERAVELDAAAVARAAEGQAVERLFRVAAAPPGERRVLPTAIHRMMVRLNWRAIVTTNYDMLLETALPPELATMEHFTWSRTNLKRKILDKQRFILKLHGDVQNHDEIILAREDYAQTVGKEPLRSALLSLFETNRPLWIGYGHADPDLDLLLDHFNAHDRLPGGFAVAVRTERLAARFESREIALSWLDAYDDLFYFVRELARVTGKPVMFTVGRDEPLPRSLAAREVGVDLAFELAELLGARGAVTCFAAEPGATEMTFETELKWLDQLEYMLDKRDRALLALFDGAQVTRFDGRDGDWAVGERRHPGKQARPPSSSSHAAEPGAPYAGAGASRSERHQVHVRVDETGVARVEIALDAVTIAGQLPVASLADVRADNWNADATAAITGGEAGQAAPPPAPAPHVHAVGTPPTFTIFAASEQRYPGLRWGLDLANAFPLDAADAHLGRSAARERLRLEAPWDACLCPVLAPTGALSVTLTLPHATLAEAHPIAQAPVPHTPWKTDWADDRDELPRARVALGAPEGRGGLSRTVTLHVERPRPGFRYGFKYRLAGARPPLRPEVAALAQMVLDRCRKAVAEPGSLLEALSSAIGLGIDEVTGGPPGPDDWWVGRMWSPVTRQLVPAFGHFPPELWVPTFGHGEGVAGHAFRVRGPAVYRYTAADLPDDPVTTRSRLLYRARRHDAASPRRDRWIVEIPLLEGPRLPAVGTIGFSNRGDLRGPLGRKLAGVVDRLTRGAGARSAGRRLLDQLTVTTSYVFWYALSRHSELGREVFERHWERKKD